MPSYADVFEVIVHTEDILVIQTNIGKGLANKTGKSLDGIFMGLEDVDYEQNHNHDVEGISDFGYFNLGLHVNDNAKKVLANRGRLLSKINKYLATANLINTPNGQPETNLNSSVDSSIITYSVPETPQVKSIHWLNQIHSQRVIKIPFVDTIDNEIATSSLKAPLADAMVTTKPHTALSIMTADCVPIVLYDKTSHQVAAIHAGWKGLANGVIAETYAALKSEGLARDCDIIDRIIDSKGNDKCKKDSDKCKEVQAWIGTCISQSCYEVSKTVVDKLILACGEMGMNVEEVNRQIVAKHSDPNKAWLDLPALAALQLKQLGINIMVGAYACSYSNAKYYSYRRKTHLHQLHTGRMATLIMLLR